MDTKKEVSLPELLDKQWVSAEFTSLQKGEGPLLLDFSHTKAIDSAGLTAIRVLQKKYDQVELINISNELQTQIDSWKKGLQKYEEMQEAGPQAGYFEAIGSGAVKAYELSIQALTVLSEMLYWGTIGIFRKKDIRKGTVGEQMYQLGYKALGIVVLLSFLVGIVIALQSAMFLKMYGAGIYLASMIGWAELREFGPLITAIILAGRTGSATTAEIATMGVGEELDALQTMGINPIQFVVVPKFWAITLTTPPLTILATAAGIFGGYLVSLYYLDIASPLFWGELVKYLDIRSYFAGFLKSIVFAWLIIWIGAFYGFKVKGGAEAVGRETTASVVTCIFTIIIADAIFSFII